MGFTTIFLDMGVNLFQIVKDCESKNLMCAERKVETTKASGDSIVYPFRFQPRYFAFMGTWSRCRCR